MNSIPTYCAQIPEAGLRAALRQDRPEIIGKISASGLKGRGGVAIGWQLDLGRREQARVDRTVAAGKEHACKPCDVGSLYSRPPDKRLVLGSGERHVEQPEVLPECLVVGEGLAHLCGRRRGPGLATGDVDRATSGSRVLEHDVARGGEAPAP